MTQNIEEINVVHMDEISEFAQEEVRKKVASKPKGFKFQDYVEIRMVSASPMRIDSIEPIEGTDVDWIKKKNTESGIDISDIF